MSLRENHCDLIETGNTFENAHKKVMQFLQEGQIGQNTIDAKGPYRVTNDSIFFQVYQRGIQSYELTEYRGIRISDSSFVILQRTVYPNSLPKSKPRTKNINELYRFRKGKLKADSAVYLKEYREKKKG